ncbi:MAG: DUF5664 domain-containing protein [Bacteroidales bacterium]|nr:DUF5664 domain-containing protein [Bacteroidales bacterium]
MELKDSGERRSFETGAVRDKADGKGRCDLLPLWEIGAVLGPEKRAAHKILCGIEQFQRTSDTTWIQAAIKDAIYLFFPNPETAILELAIHYEDGGRKYDDRNWEKGIPLHVYIDSAVRHLLKHLRGDTDEPHHRALLWNLFGAWWTFTNHPELNDMPTPEYKKPCVVKFEPVTQISDEH